MRWGVGWRTECWPYTAPLMNTEGGGSLYYMCLPHPPAPVLHKHRGLTPAPVWTLQQQPPNTGQEVTVGTRKGSHTQFGTRTGREREESATPQSPQNKV